MTFRKIPRDVHEDARDQARALMGTPEFAKSRDQRKRVEMRFAHLKTHHRFERMRLRGFSGAPPCGYCPKPQDTRQLFLAPAAAHTGRIVCVSESPER